MIRVLHLGFAFPPGCQILFPHLNPAGHLVETRLVQALRAHVEVESVGMLPVPLPATVDRAASDGLDHRLVLGEYAPHLWHRWLSYRRLIRHYAELEATGKTPDVVLCYNLSRVYCQFIRRLSRRRPHPRLVLLLCDTNLNYAPPKFLKRLRHRLKPFHVEEQRFTRYFDACIGMSPHVQPFFPGKPFLWMPGACDPRGAAVTAGITPPGGPVTFGFFGGLGAHAGAFDLLRAFRRTTLDVRLRVCGYGKQADQFAREASLDKRVEFLGRRDYDDCLRFGAGCDVLVNPRPAGHGNLGNFPSKLFEYAMCGRAVVSSALSGSDTVLGSDGFLFAPDDFEPALARAIETAAATPRSELLERGRRFRERVVRDYTWPIQAGRIADFLSGLTTR